jgi:hypothetical protein
VDEHAQAAEELGVDVLPDALPPEVRVVEVVVLVDLVQIFGEQLRRREHVDVDEGLERRETDVVLRARAHHYGHDVVSETIGECSVLENKEFDRIKRKRGRSSSRDIYLFIYLFISILLNINNQCQDENTQHKAAKVNEQ